MICATFLDKEYDKVIKNIFDNIRHKTIPVFNHFIGAVNYIKTECANKAVKKSHARRPLL